MPTGKPHDRDILPQWSGAGRDRICAARPCRIARAGCCRKAGERARCRRRLSRHPLTVRCGAPRAVSQAPNGQLVLARAGHSARMLRIPTRPLPSCRLPTALWHHRFPEAAGECDTSSLHRADSRVCGEMRARPSRARPRGISARPTSRTGSCGW